MFLFSFDHQMQINRHIFYSSHRHSWISSNQTPPEKKKSMKYWYAGFQTLALKYMKLNWYINILLERTIELTLPHPGIKALPLGRAPVWWRCKITGVGCPRSHGVTPFSQLASQPPDELKTREYRISDSKWMLKDPIPNKTNPIHSMHPKAQTLNKWHFILHELK